MNPKYPIYIVSKGRADSRLTSKALEKINCPYYIVVEEQEFDIYAKVIDPAKILIFLPDHKFAAHAHAARLLVGGIGYHGAHCA